MRVNIMKKQTLLIISSLGLFLLGQSAFAVEKLEPLATDSRLKVVDYSADNVVPIKAHTFVNTQIIFGENESIVDVENGDVPAWTRSIGKYVPNVLNIKPTVLGSNTDMSVITSDINGKKRYYHFHLMSNKSNQDANKGQTYEVRFVYPEEQKEKLLKHVQYVKLEKNSIINAYKNPKSYNWNYCFHGSRSIMPLHVFDDGKFTYLQLRPNQPVPAIFAVNNKAGKESVVNYRRVDNYIVIQEVAPQFTLRNGKYTVASVFNNNLITKMRRYG